MSRCDEVLRRLFHGKQSLDPKNLLIPFVIYVPTLKLVDLRDDWDSGKVHSQRPNALRLPDHLAWAVTVVASILGGQR
jgi:hypothetical protein